MKRANLALAALIFSPLSCTKSDAPSARQKLEIRAEPSGQVDSTRELTVAFSTDMVSDDELNRPIEDRDLLELTPKVPGIYRWSSRRTLVFAPKEIYTQSTVYEVKVKRALLGEHAPAFDDFSFSFHTPRFELLTVQPFFQSTDKLHIKVNLEFNYPVRLKDARAQVEFIDGEDNALGARLASEDDGRVIAFDLDPLPLSLEKRRIRVRVAEGLKAIGGGELDKEVIKELEIDRAGALTVLGVQAQDQEGQFQISVEFSSVVSTEAFQRALVLTPKTKIRITEDYRRFVLHGEFAAGNKYKVQIKEGLRSTDGAILAKPFEEEVAMADLAPSLRFSSRGAYLLKSGQKNLGIESINVEKVDIRIGKIFDNNLVHVLPSIHLDTGVPRVHICRGDGTDDENCVYEDESGEGGDGEYYGRYGGYASNYQFGSFGRWLKTSSLEVRAKKNEIKTTALAFDELDIEKRPGLYRLEINDAARPWMHAEKWLIKTDLGLTTKVSSTEVWARVHSLGTSKPVSGVEVSLISATNEVIDMIKSDQDGVAVFKLDPVLHALERPVLATAKLGDDYSFLAFAETELPTADFDVAGEESSVLPYSAYIYSDRGVYRPGEAVHLVALVRSRALATPPEFPLVLEVFDPAMRLVQTLRGSTKDDGAESFDVTIPDDATTGRYRFRLAASTSELGHLELLVEEFMPDRIKVEVHPKAADVDANEPAKFELESSYLFGAKAAGLTLEASCRFEEEPLEKITPSGFAFAAVDPFGDQQRPAALEESLGQSQLDKNGKAQLECALPEGSRAKGPVRTRLFATVTEEGGRSVSASATATLHPSAFYVGARRTTVDSWIKEGEDAGLEAYVIDRQLKARAGVKLEGTVSEVEWRSILKLIGGRYSYVDSRTEKVIHKFELTSSTVPLKIPFAASLPGYYRLKLSAEGNETSTAFFVGGRGQNAWSMHHPDRVALTADKERYQIGETANILVRAPYAGRLFVTLERERVLWSKTFELDGTTGTISVPMIQTAMPNVYVVAQLIRANESKEKMAPERAFGVLPVQVDSEEHRLSVEVEAPAEMRPNNPLEVKVKIRGAGKSARVTVAAVDEGILQLTDFVSPDPFAWFFKKRRLSVATHDVFSLLLPELELASGASDKGGGDREVKRKHYNPISVKRVKPIALWSGVVTTGADGIATVKLDVPELNGSLRVMAVAFEKDRLGAAHASVTVRDPIVLLPTIPRFAAPLDRFKMPVQVFNGTGAPASIAVRVDTQGGLKVRGHAKAVAKLAKNASDTLIFELEADEVAGKAAVVISAATPEVEVKSHTELPIRPVNTTVTEAVSASAQQGQPATLKLPGGFMPSTYRARIDIGPTPTSQLGPALAYLLNYPYGCVEQTTSKSFPLLYLEELAKSEGTKLSTRVDVYVAAGIARLFTMQLPDGGLSYWPGTNYGYPWTSAYAAHFMVEAKKAGFEVESSGLGRLLDHLETIARGGAHPRYGTIDTSSRMYALYVLSLAGRPARHELLEAVSVAERSTLDSESRALLGAALLLAGDKIRADKFLAADFRIPVQDARSGMYSTTRELAIVLSLLADHAPLHTSVPLLINALTTRAHAGYWYNTQENAYALMALGKIHKKIGVAAEGRGTFFVDGKAVKTFSPKRAITIESDGPEWVGRELSVVIEGTGTVWIGATVEGIRPAIMLPHNNGLEVARAYFSRSGAPLDPAKDIVQGDLVVVRDRVVNKSGKWLENLAVVDMLPAGLEIENPRLQDVAAEIPWMKNIAQPVHLDIRDDRALFFTEMGVYERRDFYYAARALTEGAFVMPHLFVEAMYDPATNGLASGGNMVVRERAP